MLPGVGFLVPDLAVVALVVLATTLDDLQTVFHFQHGRGRLQELEVTIGGVHPESFRVDQIELDVHVEVVGVGMSADNTLMVFQAESLGEFRLDILQDVDVWFLALDLLP
ncbi:hypothetical protein CLV41_12132 [Roseibium marinum]|uniref:Uncharacterized protein n=1 Tax=Roseibium marinum TaxID=281252 RepID=A0A2S3UJC6_9HYPH|nr:hypothetical protein CLV41_12132 [Roseibium marinum]